MLEELKERVYKANMDLFDKGIIIYTWGNVSEIDREKGLIAIKPSGVEYEVMRPEDIVIVDLIDGKVVEGKFKPSSDTPTHLELYRSFSQIGGIAHTHSANAVAFAQAGVSISVLGTTHADYFYGDIPCTRELAKEEIEERYETNTGKVIVETINNNGNDPMIIPGILVKNHGPFTWGKDSANSVYNAVVMEKIAEMCLKTLVLNPKAHIAKYIIEKHFMRKHGANAYYGQNED